MTVMETDAAQKSPANGGVRDSRATTAISTVQCRGTRKDGQPCASRILLDDGFCHFHSPTAAVDPAAIGRLGAARSTEIRREQAKSVRDRLREKVETQFQEIADAFDAGLASDDERVRVATAQALLAEAYGKTAVAITGGEQPVKLELVSLLAMAQAAGELGEGDS